MPDENEIVREIEVPATIDRVWNALTDAKELSAWFGSEAEIDELCVGGAMRFGWNEQGHDGYFHAVIEAMDEPNRFVYRWARPTNVPVAADNSTVVEFTLTAAESGTHIHLREHGFAQFDPEIRARCIKENTSGWNEEIAQLGAHLGVLATA